MSQIVQFELSDDAVERLDREAACRQMSRTAFLRAVIAIAEWARDDPAQRLRWNEQIAQAYRDMPETADERAVREAALAAIAPHLDAESPWEPDGAR